MSKDHPHPGSYADDVVREAGWYIYDYAYSAGFTEVRCYDVTYRGSGRGMDIMIYSKGEDELFFQIDTDGNIDYLWKREIADPYERVYEDDNLTMDEVEDHIVEAAKELL